MRKVMIATPAMDSRVCIHYADGIAQTMRAAQAAGIELMPVYWPNESILFHARNELVKMAVESDVDDVLWIDADQGWTGEEAMRLLSHPVDVVGAAVRKKTLEQELYNVRANSTHIPVDIGTGLLLVDGIGTGFLRMTRNVLRALWDSSVDYEKDGRRLKLVFEYLFPNGHLVSEDFALCEKLKELQYRIHLDQTVNPSHFGIVEFKGDFATWLKSLQTKAA